MCKSTGDGIFYHINTCKASFVIVRYSITIPFSVQRCIVLCFLEEGEYVSKREGNGIEMNCTLCLRLISTFGLFRVVVFFFTSKADQKRKAILDRNLIEIQDLPSFSG